MRIDWDYGASAPLSLELDPQAVLAELGADRNPRKLDLRANVAAALASPMEFPPVRAAIVPGDRVVLTVAPGLATASELVATVVAEIDSWGIELARHTVWPRTEGAYLDEPYSERLRKRMRLTWRLLSGLEEPRRRFQPTRPSSESSG